MGKPIEPHSSLPSADGCFPVDRMDVDGGGRGIRTLGGLHLNGFQVRPRAVRTCCKLCDPEGSRGAPSGRTTSHSRSDGILDGMNNSQL